jgi:dihydrodipicolinate synthase/N-acetylneuraminate lyase
MAMMGKLAEPEFRLPMCRLGEANRPRLKAVLASLGLVKG